MQTFFWKTSFKTIFLISSFCFLGCEKESDSNISNNTDNSLLGVWVRTNGPSGDETDIAIGSIPGEPANRVYMCEWRGSVGLYKGYINGNTITWDSQYDLPDASAKKVGSHLEFYYPSISFSVPTLYDSGSWSNLCGELENTPKNIYYSWTTSSTCPYPSGYPFTYNYPDLPSELSKNQLYGPLSAGTIEIIFYDGTALTSKYNNLSAPPAGYKRIYTHIVFGYNNTLNRCIFNWNSDDSSILTYVDQPL